MYLPSQSTSSFSIEEILIMEIFWGLSIPRKLFRFLAAIAIDQFILFYFTTYCLTFLSSFFMVLFFVLNISPIIVHLLSYVWDSVCLKTILIGLIGFVNLNYSVFWTKILKHFWFCSKVDYTI